NIPCLLFSHTDHCAATDELASLASKLALSEARNRELETSLRVSRKDRLCVQHSKDEAYTQLQQLRTYIGSSAIDESLSLVTPKRDPPEPISPDEITLTRGLTDKVSSLQEENEQLKRELDLSLVRVRSLEAVLHLQEKQLCSSDTNGKTLATSETVTKREQLLACWRKQVLRMLIEVENYKAELAGNVGKLTRQYQLLDDTRRSAFAEHEALQLKLQANQAAFLAEKQRVDLLRKQLQREKSKHEALQKSYSEFRKVAMASLSGLHAHAAKLSHTALQFLQPPADSERLPANSPCAPHLFYRLRQLERRLNFAVNRLPLLGVHMTVRRSVAPGRLISHAQAEAEQLKQERDSVLRKLEQNARTFNERVQTAQEEVQLEISNLRELTRVLEESLKNKNEELNNCHMQVDELKTCQLRIQQEATEERSRLQAQLAETNKQLAKAKVEVRRAERRIDRELNERKLLIAEMEDSSKSRIQHPEHTSHAVQPDLCATDVKVNLQPVLTGSTDPNMSHSLNPAQLDAVAKSLHQLTQLAKCLKSDSSDDADSNEIQT
ncbi:coiled-coil alpha-helical rod protein 1, partial [Paragonimus westermani]